MIQSRGLELTISTHYAQPSDNPPVTRRRDAQIAAYHKQIVAKLKTLR
jgi:hypothetical protein